MDRKKTALWLFSAALFLLFIFSMPANALATVMPPTATALPANAGNAINSSVQQGTWTASFNAPNIVITSLAIYDGKLYAGGVGVVGGRAQGYVYVYDGTSWKSTYGGMMYGIGHLITYGGRLYASTNGLVEYVYDGKSWNLLNTSPLPPSLTISALEVYNDKLYAGTKYGSFSIPVAGEYFGIYVYDGTSWNNSVTGPIISDFAV